MRAEAALPWLHLQRVTGGGATLRHLLERFGKIEAIYQAAWSDLLPSFAGDQTPVEALRAGPDPAQYARELAWLDEPGNHLLIESDPLYPRLLRELAGGPPLLFVCGDPRLLSGPQLARLISRAPGSALPAGWRSASTPRPMKRRSMPGA